MARTRVVGLTGGIASGKSAVGRMFRDLGAPVVDADVLARMVVEPGQPAHRELVQALGEGILAPDGTILRKRLGELVFADERTRKLVNAITHPRIAVLAQAEAAAHAARGEPVVLYEAALLVENGLHNFLDGLIVVSAPEEQQVRRLVARDALSEAEARARVAAQLPLSAKLAVADWVIDNSGSRDATRAQVERIWRELAEPSSDDRPGGAEH